MLKILLLISIFISQALFAQNIFRDKDRTHNRLYEFELIENTIQYRLKDLPAAKWRNLPIPKNLTSIKTIASDDEYVIAIDGDDYIFTMFNGLSKNENDFEWTRKWGSPFWKLPGSKMKLPANGGWDISFFSPAEDKYYLAFNGNKYKVGQGVTNIFFLGEDKQTIIYLDPWLPRDESYQACSPLRGRFKAANLSSSGSTIFLIGENGDMYTRLFDFDIAGADGLFFTYTYKKKEYTAKDNSNILGRKFPRPLPLPEWSKQPSIEGIVTSRITVQKIGVGGTHRTLVVEGVNNSGRSGYFTKDILEDTWSFVATDLPLKGRILENGSDDESLILGEDKSLYFILEDVKKRNYTVNVPDFNPYCTPSTIVISMETGEELTLLLHTREKIRQSARSKRGLYKKPLKLYGTIEIPLPIKSYSKTQQKLIKDTLNLSEKYTDVRTSATDKELKISKSSKFNWKLTR